MRFGLFLMPEPLPWSNWTLSYDLKLEEIVKAEHLTATRFGRESITPVPARTSRRPISFSARRPP